MISTRETKKKNTSAPRWAPIDDAGPITFFLSQVKYLQGMEVEDFLPRVRSDNQVNYPFSYLSQYQV